MKPATYVCQIEKSYSQKTDFNANTNDTVY